MVNIKLVVEFFALRYLKTFILFDCSSNISELRSAVHYTSKNFNGTIQIVNISSEVTAHLLRAKMSSIRSDLGLTVDASCEQTENIFKTMSQNCFFNASYEWLLFSKNAFNSTIRLLRQQNLNVDSRVTVADETDHGFLLYDVYNTLFRRNGKYYVTFVGHWKLDRGFSFDCKDSLYEQRYDFQNVALYVVFTDLKSKHNKTITERLDTDEPLQDFALWRFSYHYVQMLSMKHNFRVQYITTPGWGSQSILAQNTSTGLLGQLKQRQVDFALNLLYVYQDRIAIVDYSVVVAMHNCRFVFRHPRRVNTRITFLQPFDNSAWFGLLVGSTVAGLFLFVAFRLERTFPRNVSSISQEYFLTILGFICLQGYAGIKFLSASPKVIIVVMLTFALVIYQYYSSYIIGSLLTSPPRYLNTIRQLIFSDLEITIENLFYLWEFYNRTTNPDVAELFEKKILKGSETSTDVISGIQKIRKGGYAMQCDIGYAYPIIKRTFTDDEICDLQEIEVYPKKPLHLPLPKGSPLKQFYRVTLRKLIESGSGPYYEREFFSQKPACSRNSLEQVAQIEVVQVVHVFYILALAMLLCLILLVIEQIHYRFHQRRERLAPYMS